MRPILHHEQRLKRDCLCSAGLSLAGAFWSVLFASLTVFSAQSERGEWLAAAAIMTALGMLATIHAITETKRLVTQYHSQYQTK